MRYSTKLKPPALMILTAILLILTMISVMIFSEKGIISKWVLEMLFIVIFAQASIENIFLLIKTKNKHFLGPVSLYSLIFLVSVLRILELKTLLILFTILTIPFAVWTLAIRIQKKLWRYCRDILELAAFPVKSTEDGFTQRPFPAGNLSYTKDEIQQFAKFLTKHLIALAYYEQDRIVLLIEINELNYIKFRKPDFSKHTYISFDYKGNIHVQIAQKDYKKYKEEYTFGQLCESLGNLFKNFFLDYQRDESEKIFTVLKQKSPVHSEEYQYARSN